MRSMQIQMRVGTALGHFPMSENPAQFRSYIAPVLYQILREQAAG
jgi:hypothetical protein